MLDDIVNFLSCDNSYYGSEGKRPRSWGTPAEVFSGGTSPTCFPMAPKAHAQTVRARMTAMAVKRGYSGVRCMITQRSRAF